MKICVGGVNFAHDRCELELCSVEMVCSNAKCGYIFDMLNDLARMQRVIDEGRFLASTKKVSHYMRWVMQDAFLLSRSPSSTLSSCSNQPKSSIARDAYILLTRRLNRCHWTVRDCWSLVGRVLGGLDDFDALLNKLEGHTSFVTSVCFSGDRSRVLSGSEDKTIRLWDSLTGLWKKIFLVVYIFVYFCEQPPRSRF